MENEQNNIIQEQTSQQADKKKILFLSVILFISVLFLLAAIYFKSHKEDIVDIAQVTIPSQEVVVVPLTDMSTSTEATSTEEIKNFDIVNNIKVPILATSTELLKEDTNINGVRDDVERLVATKSSTQESFDNAIRTAVVIQKVIDKKSFTKDEALTFLGEIKCSENKRSETEKKELSYSYISKISADTSELQDIVFNLLTTAGNYKTEDLPDCSL